MAGFVKLYRDIVSHWIYRDPEHFKVWFEMLANARYLKEPKKDIYEGILYTLNYGEFIYGRQSWSKRLGIGEQKLRTLVAKMISDEMVVTIKKYSKFTVYKIVNYEKFNQQDNQQNSLETSDFQRCNNQQDNPHPTYSQPTHNLQLTTNKEGKEVKKDKKDKKNIYSDDFEEFYKSYPRPEGKQNTYTNWQTCLKTFTVQQLLQASENYKKAKAGTDIQYLKSSANFLGKEKPFEDFINGIPDHLKLKGKAQDNDYYNTPEYRAFIEKNYPEGWDMISED
jgi:ribosomal protein L30E